MGAGGWSGLCREDGEAGGREGNHKGCPYGFLSGWTFRPLKRRLSPEWRRRVGGRSVGDREGNHKGCPYGCRLGFRGCRNPVWRWKCAVP